MNLDLWLDQLQDMQFLRQLHEPVLSFHFKHILIQETAYACLLLKERTRIHRSVAMTLENLFAGQLDELASELAMHYDLGGERGKAIVFYTTSGERAMQVGAYHEAIHAYERALELAEDTGVDRGNLMVHLSEVYNRRSEYEIAKQNLQVAFDLARQDNHATTAATALCGLARLASREGAHAQAQHLAEQGLEWAQQAHDPKPTALALRQLGIVRNNQGDNESAVRDLEQALELYRELNDTEGMALCLNSLGVVASDQRRLDAALTFFQQALELSQKIGDRHGMGIRLGNLAFVAQEQGDPAAAVRYNKEALAIASELGDREGIAHVNLNLGGILVQEKRFAGAMEHYRAALAETLALGSLALTLYIIAAVAEVRVKLGHYQSGARLLGFAFMHPSGTADIKLDFEPVLEYLRTALSPVELEMVMQQGSSLGLNEVVGEVFSDNVSIPIDTH